MTVDVTLEWNCATEGSPTWTVMTTGDELVWTTSALTSGTAYGSIPYITKPGAGATQVQALWVWDTSSSNFSQVTTYGGDAVNDNQNVLRWSWNGALNSSPIFTSYYNTSHATATAGDGTVLGGTTASDSRSHLKAVMSTAGLGTGWCTETAGATGAVQTTDVGQSLNGDTGGNAQYLERTWGYGSSGSQTFNVVMWVTSAEDTGEFTPYMSCKYTYV